MSGCRQWRFFGGFTVFFAAAVAFVFWGTWSPEIAFVQPDQGVCYPADFLSRMINRVLAGGAFVPGDLRFFLGGPYIWQELQYALAVYLAALGVVYYLKGRKLHPLVCYGAGAAYGLMGYNFTLFSAGHLGWFVYLMYGPFVFGLIDRCVRKGRWLNWVLLGGVLAWSSAQQPDLWLMFTLFAFVYGLFRAIVAVACSVGRIKMFLRILAGVCVSAAVMAAVGWPQLYNAAVVQTVNRDQQIADSMGAGRGQKDDIADEKAKRYVFCTNWSLPPDETLEFIMPDVNGASSDPRVSPKNRYQGRIGMQVAPGRWMPYRQHSLYMGAITVVLALIGVLVLFPPIDRRVGGVVEGGNRAEFAFWFSSALLLTLCAFGAFTPFYRVVFALPLGDYIRCPVKFVHLVEWCTAALAGFGAAALLASKWARRFPKPAFWVVAALLLANFANLAVTARGYCAVDMGDTVRIAAARETGSVDIAIVTDASSAVGAEVLVAGGSAFRDNVALKTALASGDYKVLSFRNFIDGRFARTSRERAGFAVLKAVKVKNADENAGKPVSAASVLSCAATLAVMIAGCCKLRRRRACPMARGV